MSVKRPSFQFYPLEWLGDLELHSCSPAARGIWADMLCLAHHPERYGHLTINGKPMTDAQIINRIQGASKKLLAELEEANVFSRAGDGAIYSRRMVRDEALRNVRANGGQEGAEFGQMGAEHGAKGGRPRKETGDIKPPLSGQEKPPLKPPPASAVASASASISPRSSLTPTEGAPANAGQGELKKIGESKAKGNGTGLQWANMAFVQATAVTVDRPRRFGESDEDWTDAVRSEVEQRMRTAEADANRRKRTAEAKP